MAIGFGTERIYYNNFAEHLQNAYNPNLLYPGLPYRWDDARWEQVLAMVAAFDFTTCQFWLVPRLFCRAGLASDYGQAFIRQFRVICEQAHRHGLRVSLLAGLATTGDRWHTLCPNLPAEWAEIQHLWAAWADALPGIDNLALFPGDPGACSRHGCTAETYIDRCCDIASLLHQRHPRLDLTLGTWGPPFFGWGNLQGPPGWQGEFVAGYQHTAWDFDPARAERSMRHLLHRLPDFPAGTRVDINLGFDPDGNPEGERSAVRWAREIARTRPIQTWDFSLTEGENAIVPHDRFARLFARRRQERALAPYSGGICFTMTPLLNQLSLYLSAQSFLQPDADPKALAADFYAALFGEDGRRLVAYLPLFEVVPDWGNYHRLTLSRADYHRQLGELVELLASLAGQERQPWPLAPSPAEYRQELLWHARFFHRLTGSNPDVDAGYRDYWQRVYAIYDRLPEHVDPRPRFASRRLVDTLAGYGSQP